MANDRITPKNKAEKYQARLGRKYGPQEHNKQEDIALIVAYQNGDEDAGWSLFESYSDVASIVYRFPSKPPHKTEKMKKLHYQALSYEDKEDLFQEIAFHFFKLALEFDVHQAPPFEHAVRAKLHQRVFNNFFSEHIEKEINETVFDEETDLEAKTNSILLDEGMTESLPSQHLELYQALNQLTPQQREVVTMSVVKGWNSKEISQETGLTHATVRQNLKRGLDKLKTIMIPEEEKV